MKVLLVVKTLKHGDNYVATYVVCYVCGFRAIKLNEVFSNQANQLNFSN